MKTVRVVFLVLLALLLPIRGAVAGAMLCPQGSGSSSVTHQHDHAGSPHHDEQPGSAGHANGCNVCANFCSMTPMLNTMPTLAHAMVASTVTFPKLVAAAPTFQSDGQDRPPRSI